MRTVSVFVYPMDPKGDSEENVLLSLTNLKTAFYCDQITQVQYKITGFQRGRRSEDSKGSQFPIQPDANGYVTNFIECAVKLIHDSNDRKGMKEKKKKKSMCSRTHYCAM